MWRNSKVVTGSRYIELIVPASNHLAEYLKSVGRGKGQYKSWFEGKSWIDLMVNIFKNVLFVPTEREKGNNFANYRHICTLVFSAWPNIQQYATVLGQIWLPKPGDQSLEHKARVRGFKA